MKKPYTIFGETRNVPVKVYFNGHLVKSFTEWDEDYWIERGEDWYGLMSSGMKNKRVRVIERDIWLKGELI